MGVLACKLESKISDREFGDLVTAKGDEEGEDPGLPDLGF